MPKNEAHTLTQDTAYELLSNKRRRFVISRLRRAEGAVSIDELAEGLAAWENEIPESELTDTQIKRLYVSLYQIHVPKLEEAELVTYDKEEGQVRLTSAVSALDSYLPQQETAEEGWGRWQLVYTGLAAAAIGLYVGVLLFPEVFTWLSIAALNVVTVAAFLTVTVTQHLLEHR
jgi:DNA-binding transcriptional ArsR family regulator